MWRQDGLCRIQAELGHEALCKTCREFPRLRHDYGSFVELGLELHPEALGKFRKFHEYMVEKNKVMNLTGITEDGEAARLHYLDCCALLAAEDFFYPIASEEAPQVLVPGTGFVYAPAVEGAEAGDAYVLIEGKAVGKVPVVYGQTIEQTKEEESSFWKKLLP